MRRDLALGQLLEDAIAAQHEAVARMQAVRHLVQLQRTFGPHRAGDHIGLRVTLGLFRAERAGIHHLLHQGMVVGDAVQLPAAQQVDPAIPGPERREMRAPHQQDHDGGGDDAAPPTRDRAGLQLGMDGGEAQPHLGQHLGRGEAGGNAAQALRDGRAGHIARAMAARPIRHGPKAEIGPVHQIVLVARADRARMRRGAGGGGHGGASSRR